MLVELRITLSTFGSKAQQQCIKTELWQQLQFYHTPQSCCSQILQYYSHHRCFHHRYDTAPNRYVGQYNI